MSGPIIDPGTVYELVVSPAEVTVSLATPGPQGPPGPPGPAGGSTFVYDRAGVPAATWTVEHDLGRRVHVTIVGDDGREVLTDVEHVDLNNLVITFAEPFSGTALIG